MINQTTKSTGGRDCTRRAAARGRRKPVSSIATMEIALRKLGIAAIAFFALGSAAYAMGGGPYPHLTGQPDLHTPAMVGANPGAGGYGGYSAPYNGYSANLGATSPNAPGWGWGPGDAWGNFPGSTSANGS